MTDTPVYRHKRTNRWPIAEISLLAVIAIAVDANAILRPGHLGTATIKG
jgi:hypothetical protein